jgi:Zn-dependent peptidase ImmA (M78 family)
MNSTNAHITKIADDFWKAAGGRTSLPYDISGAVNLALPVDIVSLSNLSVRNIENWLAQRKIPIDIGLEDRFLHGFILVSRGNGFIFVNGTDPEEERRYTVAHEVSHFLLDYRLPRENAVKKLGPRILEVIDGRREATILERVDGALYAVLARPYTHRLEKVGDGSYESWDVQQAENDADALAVELLAPRSELIKNFHPIKARLSFNSVKDQCYRDLRHKYLIPNSVAEIYSTRIAYSVTGGPSLLDQFGF